MKAHYLLAIAAAIGALLLLAIGMSVWSRGILDGQGMMASSPFVSAAMA